MKHCAILLTMAVLATFATFASGRAQADGPGPRFGHTLVYDGQRVLLVDGYTWVRAVAPVDPPANSELWSWDGARWSRLAGVGPASRTMARAAYDGARGRLVSYGGRVGRDETASSETWEWGDGVWTRRSDALAGPNVHVEMAYDGARRQIVRFGGATREGPGQFSWPTDTWIWSGSEWARAATSGPVGRAASQMVFDSARREIVLFGGQGAAPAPGTPQPRFADTWIWNGRAWRDSTAPGPSARAFHGMSFDARRGVVLLFGGEYGDQTFDDMWSWDGSRWSQVRLAGPTPGKRRLHSMAYDAVRDRTVLYGGTGPRPTGGTMAHDDTWEWDGERWARVR